MFEFIIYYAIGCYFYSDNAKRESVKEKAKDMPTFAIIFGILFVLLGWPISVIFSMLKDLKN